MPIQIAIDGPAGAGKSTIARSCARALGFIYVDTGALYRAVGYYVTGRGAAADDPAQVIPLLTGLTAELAFVDGEQRVLVAGEDVTGKIRTPAMSMAASQVSAIPEVRRFLFALQQDIAARSNVIMDGRDIGTVVLPNADLKIFLTASDTERARRRYEELLEKGQNVTFEEVLEDVRRRDEQDRTREVSPLRQAEDAILLDTTGYSLEQSVTLLLSTIKEKLGL